MKAPRFRAIAAALVAMALAAYCTVGGRRTGLFNNKPDAAQALREHESAWRERRFGNEISRLQLEGLVRTYGGHCLTTEAEWERVDLGQRLDQYLQPEKKQIECSFTVDRPRFLPIIERYHWFLLFEPMSRNQLRLLRVRRSEDKLI